MKLTIVTVVYNRAHSIAESLASVTSQTHTNLEHIVIDGGSSDGTPDIVRLLKDPRVVMVCEPDKGIYDALNKGIARATGDVIGLLHSDDVFADAQVLEKVARAFADPAVDAVFGDLDYVAAKDAGRVIRRWQAGPYTHGSLRRGWMPPHPTLFLRSAVIARLGPYDASYRIAGDYEAILRWFHKGRIQAAYIPAVLVKMRVGGESNGSLGRILRKSREDFRALRTHGVGGIGTLACKNLRKLPQFFWR
jgi:glycosyltransferase involved in cell wall biosynthesis